MGFGEGDFHSLWNNVEDLEVGDPTPNLCRFAENFTEAVETMFQTVVTNERNLISINQGMLLLQKLYWEWFNATPKRHRIHMSERGGHLCLFDVYRAAYERLKLLELAVTPPMLFIPPPPRPPPAIEFPTVLGLKDEE